MYGGNPVGIERGIDGEYLLDALFNVGPTDYRGGEEAPISWSELVAYAKGTGDISEPWELRAVMSMSRAYFRAKMDRNIHSIPPVEREELDT